MVNGKRAQSSAGQQQVYTSNKTKMGRPPYTCMVDVSKTGHDATSHETYPSWMLLGWENRDVGTYIVVSSISSLFVCFGARWSGRVMVQGRVAGCGNSRCCMLLYIIRTSCRHGGAFHDQS